MSESGNEGNATPRSIVSSVIRALSATMASGGNRNSRLTVATQEEDHLHPDDMAERRAEIRYAEMHARVPDQNNSISTEEFPTTYDGIRALREETLSLMTSLHQRHLVEL